MKKRLLQVLEIIKIINRPFWSILAIICNAGCMVTWLRTDSSTLSLVLGCAWFTIFCLLFGVYIQDQTEDLIYDLKSNM